MAVPLTQSIANVDHEWQHEILHTHLDLDLVYLTSIPDHDYRNTDFFKEPCTKTPNADIFRISETVGITVAFVSNILVLLVFARVLGLSRLPSRIVVSYAVVNLVTTLSHTMHVVSATMTNFSNTEDKCRLVALLYYECWALHFNSLTMAMLERILACNMPRFYNRALHILSPTILVGPWFYWTFKLIVICLQVFKFDLGYECTSHFNLVPFNPSVNAGVGSSLLLMVLTLSILLMTRLLHSHSSGDVWEINRMQFEMRTTSVILKIAAFMLCFTLPILATLQVVRLRGMTYIEYWVAHLSGQLTFHSGPALFIVLLTRREFRKNMFLVCEAQENIRRRRTRNLLLAKPIKGSFTKHLDRPEGRDSGEISAIRLPGETSNVNFLSGPGTSHVESTFGRDSASAHGTTSLKIELEGRDKVGALETPDWLMEKKTPSRFWSIFKPAHWSVEVPRTAESGHI